MSGSGDGGFVVSGADEPTADPANERLLAIRRHVERAHMEVQAAQKLAYESDHGTGELAPLRVRFALNKAQNVLIKLLVHRLTLVRWITPSEPNHPKP